MAATYSLHIEAPVEKVFSFAVDLANWGGAAVGQRGPTVTITDLKTTMEGTGTYDAWTWQLGPLRMSGFGVHTGVVPNRTFTHRHSLSLLGTATYTVEPEGTGTRLTIEHRAGSLWKLPPLRTLADRAWLRSVAAITAAWKSRLEEPAPLTVEG